MAMSAHVARVRVRNLEYLTADRGWASNPASAAIFASSREATREALRLPGSVKAFALPFIPAAGSA